MLAVVVFIQARLGVVIGPSPEMDFYVDRYGIGEVADDFSAEAMREAIERLTVESVTAFKANSHAHAEELAGHHDVDVWERIITAQMQRKRR